MGDYGIKVSTDEIDAKGAAMRDLLLSTRYPFHKLDVTKRESFQNISLNFVNEPPTPDGVGTTSLETTVYRFEHGYTYIPAVWVLYQNLYVTATVLYGYRENIINTISAGSFAFLVTYVDDKYVTFKVRKNYFIADPLNPPALPNIAGYKLKLRCYVFAEDVGV